MSPLFTLGIHSIYRHILTRRELCCADVKDVEKTDDGPFWPAPNPSAPTTRKGPTMGGRVDLLSEDSSNTPSQCRLRDYDAVLCRILHGDEGESKQKTTLYIAWKGHILIVNEWI